MIHIEWGRVPLRLMPTRMEVRFYGIMFGRVGVGVLRPTKRTDWSREASE